MKRRHVNVVFAVLTGLCATLAFFQWLDLRQLRSVNTALGQVPAIIDDDGRNGIVQGIDESPIEVKFARATALLRAGHLEQAEKYLSTLAQDEHNPELAVAAQYNLANGYLRAALASDVASGRFRSLVELAKQRYRDLLEVTPTHWDTRHNLELALRLVPEQENYGVDERGKPIKSVSVVFPGFEDRELP